VYYERIIKDYDMTKKDVPNLKVCKGKKGGTRGDIVSEGRSNLHSRPLSTIDYIVISTKILEHFYSHFNVLFDKSLYPLD
jgi:hypothetical protein